MVYASKAGNYILKRLLLVRHELERQHKAKRNLSLLTGRHFSSTAVTGTKNEVPSDGKVVSILQDRDLISKIPLEDVRNFCFIGM